MSTALLAQGSPSKAFFIDMITRDIGITDAILDLIDNAIDSAITHSGVDVMAGLTTEEASSPLSMYTVALEVGSQRVSVADNCGGIPVAEAEARVFRFGAPQPTAPAPGLSVYGIGMKRAFFKLGSRIQLTSRTESDFFEADIDVPAWQAKGDEDWSFPISKAGPAAESPSRENGTVISIVGLYSSVSKHVGLPSYLAFLRERMQSTYALFLKHGLKISVNGEPLKSLLPQLGTGTGLSPARRQFEIRGIHVLIIAGITPRQEKTPGGWHVFCNGRMVLGGDRSRLTGWGDPLPAWHDKFNHFSGYVYFWSSDVRDLPWTTTKQGIVYESTIYQAALGEMQVQARPAIQFLSRMYPADVEPESVVERGLFEGAAPTAIDQLPRLQAPFKLTLPATRRDSSEKLVAIQYKKTRREIDRAKACREELAQASARQVGSYTFDYFLQQESD